MVTSAKLPFTDEFQTKILGLMMHNYDAVAELEVKPEYFSDPVCSEICRGLVDLKRDFGLPITMSMLEEKLMRDGEDSRLLKYSKRVHVMKKPVGEPERKYLTKELISFVKYQAIRSGLSSAVDKLRAGDIEGVEAVMARAFQVGKTNGSIGLRYFTGVSERVGKRRLQKEGIRTLITELDACLDNYGLNQEELGVVLAPPGRGKSFFLMHVAKTAVIQKNKVVFYTLEMSEEKVAERLDASFTGIEIRELRQSPVKALEKIQQLGRRYGESLIIKRYPAKKCDVNVIRAHLERLAVEDFYPNMIIVDYGDLMSPLVLAGGDRYYELGNVYEELKGLAQEGNFVIWTACLTGDALIDCPRDLKKYPTGIPLRDLVGKSFYTYAYSKKLGRIVLRKASNVRCTRLQTKVWKLKLDNGAFLKATPDHRIMRRDGTYCQLCDLKPGDSLMPFYRRISGGWNHKVVSVEFAGCEDVYDMEVQNCHNFVANGVVVHNSQASRAAYSKELVTIEEISESFQKAMIADVIVSLCQNSEEKTKEKLRLYLAKNKQEMSNVVIPIYSNFKKGSFYRKTT